MLLDMAEPLARELTHAFSTDIFSSDFTRLTAGITDEPSGVGSIVAGAMEYAGTAFQAKVLDKVNSTDGQILAGFIYLIGIATAVITVAIGGNYKWGKYLLVGPPLFFFLTQVRTQSNGVEWRFGQATYPDTYIQRALEDVVEDKDGDVALFYQFWNIFMTELSQKLVDLVGNVQEGSNLNFLTKLERYMNFWLNINIPDQNLRMFMKTALANKCADYYMMLRSLEQDEVNDVVKADFKRRIEERKTRYEYKIDADPKKENNEVHWWLVNKLGMTAGKSYTCQELWEETVKAAQPLVKEIIDAQNSQHLAAEQTPEQVKKWFNKKIGTVTSRGSDKVDLNAQQQALAAVDWLLAKALWQEINEENPYFGYMDKEGRGAYFASRPANGMDPNNSGNNTSNSIRQFNRTETYQFKGDFVQAALAMPHFQGLGLLMLATLYPFFAMAVILPGRAGAILTWMNLWAWLKLWDVGFALVMMIDDILYAIFPRGPNLAPGDIKNAGRAWARILEQDPSFSAAAYYNIIATCMFAVPVATAVFVKGGSRELTNLVQGGWQQMSSRIAGSAAAFERSLQAQSYVRRQRLDEFGVAQQALDDAANDPTVQGLVGDYVRAKTTGAVRDQLLNDLKTKNKSLREIIKAADKSTDAVMASVAEQKKNMALNAISAYAHMAVYEYSQSEAAFFAAESAHAARYYSHDTGTDAPTDQIVAQITAANYFNDEHTQSTMVDSLGKGMFGLINNTWRSARGD